MVLGHITTTNPDFKQWIYTFHMPCFSFVNSYNYIYTTRLHIAILATLLEKPCTFIDNNYGKNSGFYQTWLNDIDDIIFIYE